MGDSGACATALLTGVKARYETIGLDDRGIYEDCQSSFDSRVKSIADWAQEEGIRQEIANLLLELIRFVPTNLIIRALRDSGIALELRERHSINDRFVALIVINSTNHD